MKKKKILIVIAVIMCIAIVLTIVQCRMNILSAKIPYLPVNSGNVTSIIIATDKNREATEAEKIQIINWINSIKRYESLSFRMVDFGGKPDQNKGILIYLKVGSSICLEEDAEGNLFVAKPFRVIGTDYYVKQSDIAELLS